VPVAGFDLPPPDGPFPSVRFAPCPFEINANNMRCGVLDTFENYEKTGTDARIIQVAFGIIPAKTTPTVPDPIVVFTGGPGASDLAFAQFFAEFEAHTDDRDLILVDQRGVGFSSPFLQCGGLLFYYTIDVAAAKSCIEKFESQGVDLSQYRSAVIAQDFKALREALEIDQWNIYGGSYGPIPGILYAELDPAGVRTVIFDSSTDNQVDIALADVAAVFDIITELGNLCAAEAECAARLPDFQSIFIETFRSLTNEPWVVNVPDKGEAKLDGFELYAHMFDGAGIFSPGILEIFTNRDTDSMVRLLTRIGLNEGGRETNQQDIEDLKKDAEDRLFADLMHTTVQCAAIDAENYDTAIIPTREQWPDDILNSVRAEIRYPLACNPEIISIEQDLLQREPISLDVPALILGGGLDDVVSLKQVRQLNESFTSSTLAIVPKGGHVVGFPDRYTDPCVKSIVKSFLENPANELEITCLTENVEAFVFGDELIENY